MPTLHELQHQFVAAVLSGRFDSVSDKIRVAGSTAERRLGIYRNNTFTNLRSALREVYPSIEALVGAAFFRHAADAYIAAHPSVSGDLNDYGGHFAAFLSGFAPAAGLPYLADVARLEWALESAYYAADHPPLEIARLAEISPERYADLRLALHPAATLIQSAFPLHAIWQVHQPDYAGDGQVDLASGGVNLLVARRGSNTVVEPLDSAEFIFLSTLSERKPLVAALTAALEADPAFPFQERLVQRVVSTDIVAFHLADVRA